MGGDKCIKDIELQCLPHVDDLVVIDGTEWKVFSRKFVTDDALVLFYVCKHEGVKFG